MWRHITEKQNICLEILNKLEISNDTTLGEKLK